ncbi:hypothetical protein GALL_349720 [mine drainage metagenome]|uniref:Uncharacterized protein n=1 Tax=mine drainage metagenome TaxID=410659 RepID=A0A1J5QTP0_9ZZZZ
MRWICYDERETFSIEAQNLEQAVELASVYEAKVLGPATGPNPHHAQVDHKSCGAQLSAMCN